MICICADSLCDSAASFVPPMLIPSFHSNVWFTSTKTALAGGRQMLPGEFPRTQNLHRSVAGGTHWAAFSSPTNEPACFG